MTLDCPGLCSQAHTGTLTVILDGMDKGKFKMPRFEFGQTPKDFDKYKRAVLNLARAS